MQERTEVCDGQKLWKLLGRSAKNCTKHSAVSEGKRCIFIEQHSGMSVSTEIGFSQCCDWNLCTVMCVVKNLSSGTCFLLNHWGSFVRLCFATCSTCFGGEVSSLLLLLTDFSSTSVLLQLTGAAEEWWWNVFSLACEIKCMAAVREFVLQY